MAKKLNLLPDEEFSLLGIVARVPNFRLLFEVNSLLGTNFKRLDDLEIQPLKQSEFSVFSKYTGEEDDNGRIPFIIANKGSAGLLVPEQKQMDYFLLLKGTYYPEEIRAWIERLRTVRLVQGVYEIPVRKLKSRQNLIF
jgi:hypothetical protein